MVRDYEGMSNYEQGKSQERKRKAEYLESIFENVTKKQSQDHHNNNNEGLLGKEAKKHTGTPTEKTTVTTNNSSGNSLMAVSVHRADSQNRSSAKVTSASSLEPPKAREKGPSASEASVQFAGFQTTSGAETIENRASTKERDGAKTVELNNGVKVKEEANENEALQLVSVQGGQHEEKVDIEGEGDIGDDFLKYLLFAGKLYHCESVSDLTHNYSRFTAENLHSRKGKVIVLLLFHKIYREVVRYVVGVIEHSAMKEQSIVIRIIKSHTYPSPRISVKDLESKTSKLVVGSKKLLYNLQCLEGPVYCELVKILDGFGANSAVDHSKIREFNAMINANADLMDSNQLSNYISGVSHSLLGTSNCRTFVSPTYGYIPPRVPQSNPRHSPLATRPALDGPYSPLKQHGGGVSSASDRFKPGGPRTEAVFRGYSKPMYTSEHHDRAAKGDRPLYTIAANETVHISPGTYNSGTCAEFPRSAAGIPAQSSLRFHPAGEEKIIREGALASQRRNVEDLQTVAELCKEKMKRDMAEQELKSIKAAFEQFKSQMQHHLSQVEERMVLLEAENRNLKGKLSNMHQTNGFAEKKYHELRSRLENLLKST